MFVKSVMGLVAEKNECYAFAIVKIQEKTVKDSNSRRKTARINGIKTLNM